MQNIFPLIIAGVFFYLMFFRRGRGEMGMGCCGGHFGHDSESPHNKPSDSLPGEPLGNVIDLKEEEDYTVLPSNETPLNRRLIR